MRDMLSIIEKVAPDFIGTLRGRYDIMRNIYLLGPVGRRLLAQKLNVTERSLRTETDYLKAQDLLASSKLGMELTEAGLQLYHELDQVMGQLLGMNEKEKQLAAHFGIEHCTIVAGNSDVTTKVFDDFGRNVTEILNILLPHGENIVAVMGGTTMARLAEMLTPVLSEDRSLIFVPARGGIGESIEIQANAICAKMAQQTHSEHRVLYVPEHVSINTYESLLKEPVVQEILEMIEQSNVVLHSIGVASHMAERRNMSPDVLALLKDQQAVGEAFGYFFNEQGDVVYNIPRIGLQLKDLHQIPYILAIAGGFSKAKAIESYMKNAPQQTRLITDEGAANEILRGETF